MDSEFLAILVVTIVTVITPGPDFLVVVRNTLVIDRKAGIYTGLGVSTAIWVHIAYSILLVSYVSSTSVWSIDIVKLCGGFYLLWMGSRALSSKSNDATFDEAQNNVKALLGSSWRQGFMNNILNPKATIFFVSVFSHTADSDVQMAVQLSYGLVITGVCIIWFCTLPVILSLDYVLPVFRRHIGEFQRLAGLIFISFAILVFYEIFVGFAL
ncbi:LysE family translocator [Allohahella sp. A8]|uniref:LysE family translocator n=1 Tax=Allohahella sp. A8 TaxID=3141461 RepID=UPI000C0B7BB3|nr:hypothetical protein [Hahellaceae bacterium]|tara:strand:- start:54040 stop:54675 length:636 start_codon:yes stop_codon:yes gene_type:complete